MKRECGADIFNNICITKFTQRYVKINSGRIWFHWDTHKKLSKFLSDFSDLNTQLKRKPHPMPKINKMLLKWEGFQFATLLDFNMRYYHIPLTEYASNLCTIIIALGKYRYKHLPMVVSNSPENFQQKMNHSFQGFEFTRAYIDDL